MYLKYFKTSITIIIYNHDEFMMYIDEVIVNP